MNKITLKICRRKRSCATSAVLCSAQQQISHCNRAQHLIRISEVKKKRGEKTFRRCGATCGAEVDTLYLCVHPPVHLQLRDCTRDLTVLCINGCRSPNQKKQTKRRVHACVISNTLLASIHSGLAPAFSMSDTLTNTQTDKHSH